MRTDRLDLVEPTPCQRVAATRLFATGVYRERLLALVDEPVTVEDSARIPKRSASGEVQAAGAMLPERQDKTAWRDTWAEIRRVMEHVAALMEHGK